MDENLKQKLRDMAVENISSEIRYLEGQIETFAENLEKDLPSMDAKEIPEYEALKAALEAYKKALQEKARESF